MCVSGAGHVFGLSKEIKMSIRLEGTFRGRMAETRRTTTPVSTIQTGHRQGSWGLGKLLWEPRAPTTLKRVTNSCFSHFETYKLF